MTTILIKNGTIVNADFTQKADILVGENGKILQIAPHIASEDLAQPAAREMDATGKYILPGGIDPHVHLELSFMGQYSEPPETGTRCAIAGGTTLLIDFIIPPVSAAPGILLETYQTWVDKYKNNASCNYSFHGCITKWDSDTMPSQLKELAETAGLNSTKMFMAYKNALSEFYPCSTFTYLILLKLLFFLPLTHNLPLPSQCWTTPAWCKALRGARNWA